MAYLDSRRRPDFRSMAAVVALHGAAGAALVLGLTVTGVIEEDEIFVGVNVRPTETPPPPSPPPPEPSADPVTATPKADPFIPEPPIALPTSGPVIDGTDMFPPPQPPVQPGGGDGISRVIPQPVPTFTPVAARPRNDPLRWVTTDDYKGNWIRQEMTGKARFRLDIAADGRVTGCTITGTSGHAALDEATCTLVSKRARFQPARGAEGEPVPSSYANAIDWQLPE